MKHSGIEVDERDPKVTPAQDLYRHINGKWLERTVIPADRARYGSFHKLVEAAEEAVRDIATECQGAADGTSARKIGDLYQSFMDEEAVEIGRAEVALRGVERVVEAALFGLAREDGGLQGALAAGKQGVPCREPAVPALPRPRRDAPGRRSPPRPR